MEYTGQLIGGPDNGNLITSTVPEFRCEVAFRWWLDGDDRSVCDQTIRGTYVWDGRVFRWVGGELHR